MIEITGLTFKYKRQKEPLLSQIDLRVPRGRVCGLLGPNGAGKTTLLSLIAGLKYPKTGMIMVDGMNPFYRSPDFLGKIYYLPEGEVSSTDSALHFAWLHGRLWPGFSRERFLALADILAVHPERKLSEMSRGERKKTQIAMALACRTPYLFMDEPTNGLDIDSKRQFRKALASHAVDDATILIATHQISDVENMLDFLILITSSEVVGAPVEDICTRLCFETGAELRPDAIWIEQGPISRIQVCPNRSGVESRLHLEALYGAFYNRKEEILKYLTF